jgi:tetratricopeptide (TPR) repeat protein
MGYSLIAGCSQAVPDAPIAQTDAPAHTSKRPVTLQTLEDVLALEPGDQIAFNHVVEQLILLQARDQADPLPDRRERWLQRRALRILRNVTLVDTPTTTIARCPNSTDDVMLTFHTVRSYACRTAGLSAAQADRLLRQSGGPVEVAYRFILGLHGKHVAGLAIQRIALGNADEVVLTADRLHVSPDTARAYEIYRQGLDLQQSRNLAEALRCFDQALGCDPQAAAIVNHVAWFRATTHAESYRDPPMSLKLALRALQACRTFGTGYRPDILDTAARACYENGQYTEALQFERDALRYDPRNRSYRDQLDMIRSKLAPPPAAP